MCASQCAGCDARNRDPASVFPDREKEVLVQVPNRSRWTVGSGMSTLGTQYRDLAQLLLMSYIVRSYRRYVKCFFCFLGTHGASSQGCNLTCTVFPWSEKIALSFADFTIYNSHSFSISI